MISAWIHSCESLIFQNNLISKYDVVIWSAVPTTEISLDNNIVLNFWNIGKTASALKLSTNVFSPCCWKKNPNFTKKWFRSSERRDDKCENQGSTTSFSCLLKYQYGSGLLFSMRLACKNSSSSDTHHLIFATAEAMAAVPWANC